MEQRTVLVTGSSRGIGAATARKFAAEGWRVALNYYQSEEACLALQKELGEGTLAIRADISDPKQVNAMVEQVLEEFGYLDAVVCNAGISLPAGLVQDCSDEDWNRVMSIDAGGVFYTVRAVLPSMIRRQSGRIVTISSMWGQVGGACEAAYSAAKGAVIAFTKAVAKEVGLSHIAVNCVAPGVIQTDMMGFATEEVLKMLVEETPLGLLGLASDVAEGCYYLCDEKSSRFITGQVLPVNGGIIIN